MAESALLVFVLLRPQGLQPGFTYAAVVVHAEWLVDIEGLAGL